MEPDPAATNSLELRVSIAPNVLALSCLITNRDAHQLNVGGLNLSNLRIDHRDIQGEFARCWFPASIRNSDGLHKLAVGESLTFDCNLLRYFAFPVAGIYRLWAVYDSVGYAERFKGSNYPHFHLLSQLDPVRAMSNIVEVNVTAEMIARKVTDSGVQLASSSATSPAPTRQLIHR